MPSHRPPFSVRLGLILFAAAVSLLIAWSVTRIAVLYTVAWALWWLTVLVGLYSARHLRGLRAAFRSARREQGGQGSAWLQIAAPMAFAVFVVIAVCTLAAGAGAGGLILLAIAMLPAALWLRRRGRERGL